MFQALNEWCESLESYGLKVVLGQASRQGRRAVLNEPDDKNPFVQYMRTLARTKHLILVGPNHSGGDSRLWEGMLSGAHVITDNSAMRFGFKNKIHCSTFDPDTDSGLQNLKNQLFRLAEIKAGSPLNDSDKAKVDTMPMLAEAKISRHDTPIARIDAVFSHLGVRTFL